MGFFANRLNEFDKGRWLVSNIQWVATLAILFKVYGLEDWLILGTIALIMGTWLIGVVLVNAGIWDSFNRASNKGLREWFTKNN